MITSLGALRLCAATVLSTPPPDPLQGVSEGPPHHRPDTWSSAAATQLCCAVAETGLCLRGR